MAAYASPSPAIGATGLPVDVRLMQATANTLFAVAGLALCAALLAWGARLPLFGLRAIKVDGEVARNSESTIRANAAPKLAGNFLTMDLGQARSAFESVPWVRRAVVRRTWPMGLAVALEEHKPAALWAEADGNDRLVNSHGEVFEANIGDVEDERLPRLSGPEGSAAAMLAMLQRLAPLVEPLQAGEISALALTARGSWRITLDKGAEVDLGRGSDDEVLARTRRFIATMPQVLAAYRRPLEAADLRHADGFAVRLRGVITSAPVVPGRRK
ncbi:MAG: cell division protein FtsQ/DivIB [Burkholderiaceae bacterium]|nr:cell division protein FtsQ/DivIB [Burkholderiaceae bacterium]